MHDIDFLPADYVCVRTTRKNDTWLRVVFVAVVGLMALGWWEQRRSFRELVACRDRAQTQLAAMISQLESADHLRGQLKQGENHHRLVKGLRLQPSPSRWLTAVVDALPAQTMLTEVHAEAVDGGTKANPEAGIESQSVQRTMAEPIHHDLRRIAKETPHRSLQISIRGAAPDDLDVSAFLRDLHRTGLFETVQLVFTDHQPRSERLQRSFAIRLRTRPLLKASRTNQPVAVDHRDDQRN